LKTIKILKADDDKSLLKQLKESESFAVLDSYNIITGRETIIISNCLDNQRERDI